MKAIKAFGPQDLRLVRELPKPVPTEGQVLIALRASGICGSDKWWWYVKEATNYIAGHEAAGEIVELGPGVKHLQVGDRVAINNVIGCGHCAECRSGRFVFCPNRPGYDVDHGFAEFLASPERNCLKLDDRLSYEAGCLIFDNWGTPFNAVKRAGIELGDDVVVSGCGPIGLASIVLSKLKGAYVVALDPQRYRRDAAVRLGADAVLAPDDSALHKIRDLTDSLGASVVLECSGKSPAYGLTLECLRIGGTFVAVGEGARIDFRPSDLLIRNHLNMLGTWYSSMHDGVEIQNLIVEDRIDPSAFVTHRTSFEGIPEAFRRVCECTDDVLKTVIIV